MVPPQLMPSVKQSLTHCQRERTSVEPSPESMHLEKEFCLAMTHESMHVEREFRLAMNHGSIHALGMRIHCLDQKLSLYPIAKLPELMPHCMLKKWG